MPDSISQLQARLAALEQENTRLRSQLDTCQQSHQALQEQVTELEESERTLEARDRILGATAFATNALVTIENFDNIIHGDGTTTAAKKGGDNLGFSGHRHMKGDKVVAFSDRNCNVIAPFIAAPGNRNESPLLQKALPQVTRIAKKIGLDLKKTIISLDGVYDSRANRKAIFNRGMVPNIPVNLRGRKTPKRGRKSIFKLALFQERFNTIERVFAWEDKFRRLLIRFERISKLHYDLKSLAYTMINLRHFCQS